MTVGADVSLQNLPASTNPGKITYFNTMNGEKKFFPLYEVKPDIPALTADIALIQERIICYGCQIAYRPERALWFAAALGACILSWLFGMMAFVLLIVRC